ncbi:hypothetical protein BOW53_02470 [Solemya pervernicosa gill symbiont]|uniref:Ribosome maturation factor RimP n=2 Tax=Gammaproteobacteria incertae sedis TaxID=118884 RepID=A0A1T2L9F7_9GAMM|nr:ribosome maturation factor RimP [Candidatus Reidiella endopervernicosa]OOZ41721.1 hypothetical protein BOW53_02470 [Solemya pervernicosa gill symbiont]QKQ26494.1 ribosome maturation factor RimP [Candidatus Reidiella endopervernicosa]
MNQDPWNLQALLDPVVEAMGYELLGIEFQGRGVHGVLRLYIDKEGGINLDDCSAVSHQVSGVLDVEDPVPGKYSLEVSSPGLDRPLFREQHFEKYLGHQAKIRMAAPMGGQKNFKGHLKELCEGGVVLKLESGTEVSLLFTDIDQARLVPKL